jgi:2,4-dienoyl-CoA reductase-like NADH-dependent reductase (Old Yellow Enzyme family)
MHFASNVVRPPYEVAAAKLLEHAGIDILDLSGGLRIYQRPGHHEPGWFSDMSTAVKKNVNFLLFAKRFLLTIIYFYRK